MSPTRWRVLPAGRPERIASALGALLALAVLALLPAAARAAEAKEGASAKGADQSLKLSGAVIHSWPEGTVRVFTIRSNARIEQEDTILTADRMVVWFDEEEARKSGVAKIRVYAESAAAFVQGKEVKRCQQFFGQFQSGAGLVVNGQVLTHSYPQEGPLLDRARKVLALGQPEYMSGKPVGPDVITPPKPAPSEGVEIRADSFDSWQEPDGTRVVVLKGNVNVVRGEYELAADRVVLWFSTESDKGEGGGMKGTFREVYAEGDVVLNEGTDMLQAEKIFQNRIENKGLLEKARISSPNRAGKIPIVIGGEEIRQIDEDRFEAEKGYITTDDFGQPHFRFQTQRLRLLESKECRVVNATHNTFRVGELPVFYWPFLTKDLKDDSWFIKGAKVGNSSDFGTFVLTDWDLYDFGIYRNDWSDVTLDLDYYSKRGPAIGVDAEYKRSNYFGYLDTYYIKDQAKWDRPLDPVPNDDRSRALWRHRQFLPEGFRLDAEVSYISDRNFLREFFEDEYYTEKEQETMVYLRKLSDNKGFTVTEKHRINRFQTTVEETPRITFDVIGEPIALGDYYLNFTSKNEIGYLQQRLSNVLDIESSPRTWRFDSRNELRAPIPLSVLTLAPFAGAEITTYDHIEALDGARSRGAGFFGVEASTSFWRVYGVKNDLLQVNRIRHIVTPEVRYENVYTAEPSPHNYYQFDEIDKLDQLQRIVTGVRNRFETKRGPQGDQKTVDWVNVNLQHTAYLGDAGFNKTRQDYIEGDLTWRVTDRILFDSKGNEINLGTGELDILNLGVQFSFSPTWKLYVGHRYVDSDPSRNVDGSSVAFFNVGYVFNEKWSAEFSQDYDYKTDENLTTRFVLTRQLPAWILQMTFELDPGERDTVGMVTLSPAGLKEGLLKF